MSCTQPVTCCNEVTNLLFVERIDKFYIIHDREKVHRDIDISQVRNNSFHYSTILFGELLPLFSIPPVDKAIRW